LDETGIEGMSLAIFSSTYSLGRSLFTLEPPEELDTSSPISIFTVAKHHKFDKILLVDDNMTGFFSAYQQSRSCNIQLCFGLNFKIINDIKIFDQSESIVTVWMRNGKGYEDLLKLNHFANTTGYRYPNAYIDWKTLNELTTPNLVVTIPFYSSFLARNLLNLGQNCLPKIEDFNPIFLVNDHSLPFDKQLGDVVRHFVKQNHYDVKEAHSLYYYNDNHSESLQTLRCIGERSTFEKPELPHFGSDQFSVESYLRKGGGDDGLWKDSFFDNFEPYDIPKLTRGVRLPEIEITKEEKNRFGLDESCSNYEYLSNLVALGLKTKVLSNPDKKDKFDEYVERCKNELTTFRDLHIVDYILLVYDMIEFCRKRDIPIGLGRGSSSGSCVAFLNGIVDVDPMDYGLYFSRFISPARAQSKVIDNVVYLNGSSLPDIDTDISFKRRQEVLDYICAKYEEKTCKIVTASTLTGKILIKEVCKIYLNYSETDAKHVADMIEKIFGTVFDLEKAYKDTQQFQKWVDGSEETKRCYEIARHLENLIGHYGVHPSGICISYHKIDELIPIMRTNDGVENVSSYDMASVSNVAVKIDALGLRTVDTASETADMIGLKISDIDLNDKSIYEFLKSTDNYHGLFQIAKGLSKQVALKVKPENVHDFAACVALSRPGCFKFIDDYVKYKETGEYNQIHPLFDEILKRTGGVLIYQESINEICQKVYGMSDIDSDQLRYYVGKKKVEEMKAMKPKMYEIGKNKGIPEEATEKFFQICEDSASYLFNFSHSVNYGSLSAITTYLKANYPLQFFLSLLRMSVEDPKPLEEIATIQRELRNFNIQLLPPSIKESQNDFEIVGSDIRFGLSAIKGISDAAINRLVSFNREYSTKFDLFNSCLESKLGVGVVVALINAGCFPSVHSRAKLILEFKIFNLLTAKERLLINQFANEFNEDLFAILKYLSSNKDVNGKFYIKETRMQTIHKSYDDYHAIYEFNKKHGKLLNVLAEYDVLGYSYSGNLASCYREEYPEIVSLYEALTDLPEKSYTFVVRVKSIREGKSKSKGTPYIRMEIWDEQSEALAMIFSDKINQLKNDKGKLLKEDIIVVCNGRRMDESMFFLNWAKPLFDVKLAKRITDVK
jgi:DNA-directed DNA polymerase III PolC